MPTHNSTINPSITTQRTVRPRGGTGIKTAANNRQPVTRKRVVSLMLAADVSQAVASVGAAG